MTRPVSQQPQIAMRLPDPLACSRRALRRTSLPTKQCPAGILPPASALLTSPTWCSVGRSFSFEGAVCFAARGGFSSRQRRVCHVKDGYKCGWRLDDRNSIAALSRKPQGDKETSYKSWTEIAGLSP